jgi:Ring finger domain
MRAPAGRRPHGGRRAPFPMRAPRPHGGRRAPFPMRAPRPHGGGRGRFPMRAPAARAPHPRGGGRGPSPMRAPAGTAPRPHGGGRGPSPMRAPAGTAPGGGRGPSPMRAPAGTAPRPHGGGRGPTPMRAPAGTAPRGDMPEEMSVNSVNTVDNSIAGILRGLNQATDEFTTGMRAESSRGVRFADEEETKRGTSETEGGTAGNGFMDSPSFAYEIVDDDGEYVVNTDVTRDNMSVSTSDEVCVVCQDRIDPRNVTVLPCRHRFHAECINVWFDGFSAPDPLRPHAPPRIPTCPVCREAPTASDTSSATGNISFTASINPEPAPTGGVSTDEAPAPHPEPDGAVTTDPEPAPTGGVSMDEAPAPHPEPAGAVTDPEPAPTGGVSTDEAPAPHPAGGVSTDEAPAPHPEPAGAVTDPEPAPTGGVSTDEAEPAPTGGVPTDEAPAPAPTGETAAAENAGAAAGVTTADSPAAGAPAPSEVAVAPHLAKIRRSKRDHIRSRAVVAAQTAAAENAGASDRAPGPADVTEASSDISGSPPKRRRGDLVAGVSGDSTMQRSLASILGVIFGPRDHPLGEVSFDDDADEVSAVTNGF